MDPDLYFVLGLGIAILAIPALFGAISSGDPPRGAAIMVLIGGGLLAIAVMNQPLGYSLSEIPDVVLRVVARYLG